ncbi:MAG: PhnD/SsuA/transferrin family substrate-binding protein, partial [Gammaproteobacteria bacterium]|nr:PhnD/SsuA/transferrin family substrate-binding protein [Gammaproteobacteria bacterium]
SPEVLYADDDQLRVGVFPRRSVAVTKEMFTPIISYLSEKLEKKVLLDVPPDMPAFWSRLENGEYDLVHMNQYHYVRAHAELGWQVILKNEEFGKATIAAALWVLKDSKIESLSDLKGKLIVFGGGDHAMVSSIMTRDILMQGGIPDDAYIGMTTLHTLKSILSVYYKQADAAGVGDIVTSVPAIQKKIDVNKLRILARSESLAHLPWAVRGDMDIKSREKIISALIMLNESRQGKKRLEAAGLTGLRKVSDSDYDPHRKIIKRVLNEQY